MTPLWSIALAAELLAISLADVLYRRVGNALIAGCFFWGVGAHAYAFGACGVVEASLLGLVALLTTLPLWLLGLCGAADIKLIAALVPCAGVYAGVKFGVLATMTLGLWGLGHLWASGRIADFRALVVSLRHPRGALRLARQKQATVPVAPALSVGLGLALAQKGLWW